MGFPPPPPQRFVIPVENPVEMMSIGYATTKKPNKKG